ncbi:hypothetical protein TGPRC2_258630 [Toxoplasma gondii TgCatPRC2]|uniref:Translation initiation factor IF-3 protein n=2 Tax=Toxoplasma gondii TaxID=5811 RepID=A0A151HLI9_TOXGO|nr:hypothetical protein TGRUB_258630 [Toxoplasma gondii RUB]KYK70263.1 hypothetical protein TGPRC2_258630 [Toxoplasma gondii TgCatPRC2]
MVGGLREQCVQRLSRQVVSRGRRLLRRPLAVRPLRTGLSSRLHDERLWTSPTRTERLAESSDAGEPAASPWREGACPLQGYASPLDSGASSLFTCPSACFAQPPCHREIEKRETEPAAAQDASWAGFPDAILYVRWRTRLSCLSQHSVLNGRQSQTPFLARSYASLTSFEDLSRQPQTLSWKTKSETATAPLRRLLARTKSFSSASDRDSRVQGNLFASDIASLPVVRVLVEAASEASEAGDRAGASPRSRRELLGDMSGVAALEEAERRGLEAVVLAGSSAKLPVCVLTPSLSDFLEQQQLRQARAKAMQVPAAFRVGNSFSGEVGRRGSTDGGVEMKEGATSGGAGGEAADVRSEEGAKAAAVGLESRELGGAREADVGTFAFDPSLKIKTVRINGVADERDMLRSAQTARKFLSQGHRVELQVVAQMHQKKTRARTSHLVLLIGGFVRECRDVGRPLHLPLNASLLASLPVIKVQIWPCSKEQAAAFQMPPVTLESPKKGKGGKQEEHEREGKKGKGQGGHEKRSHAHTNARHEAFD